MHLFKPLKRTWRTSSRHRVNNLFILTLFVIALALTAIRPTFPGGLPTATTSTTSQTESAARQAYGQLPISFEQNQGQYDSKVKYLSRGAGYSLFLTKQQAVLSLQKNTNDKDAAAIVSSVVTMRWLNANPNPVIEGNGMQEGKTNYMQGSDPNKALTKLPNYGQVQYSELYPGIDLLFYGQSQQLEYDFVVKPGADPANIRLDLQGANGLQVDDQGQLVLHTSGGDIVQPAPTIYQEVNGTRHVVSGGYVLEGTQVSFRLGSYDPTRTLVIDPVLAYSTFLGGGGVGYGIAVDSGGNAYVTGSTFSSEFPTTPGANQTATGGVYDAFVSKFNSTGTALIYSTFLGGNNKEQGNAIAVDSDGNAYVTGSTISRNFPITSGAYQTTFKGGVWL